MSVRRRGLMSIGEHDIKLPSGYTKLEYISNISRGISTGISTSGSKWLFNVMSTASGIQILASGNTVAFGDHVGVRDTTVYYVNYSKDSTLIRVTSGTQVLAIVDFSATTNNTTALTIEDTTVSLSSNPSGFAHLLAHNNSQYVFKGRIYGVTCLAGGKFNGIPAMRDSDSVNGLYDIENNQFYALT